jgi:hypothetical protein
MKGVLDGFLVPRPVVGHRTQSPLPEQTPYLGEAGEIMRGVERLVVLGAKLWTM